MKIRGNTVGTTMNPHKIADRIGGGVDSATLEEYLAQAKAYADEVVEGITPEQIGATTEQQVNDIVADCIISEQLMTFEDFIGEFYSELHYAISLPSDEGGIRDVLVETVMDYLPIYDGEVVE